MPIFIVNKKLTEGNSIFKGQELTVFDWRNKPHKLNQWTKAALMLGPFEEEIKCLVIENSSYDLLVSRPLMRSMKLNLFFDDTISFGSANKSEQVNVIRNVEDLERAFPNVVCQSDYPPPVKFFSVPFRLETDTPVCRKPYKLSRAKEDFVRQEIESMKAKEIIRESSSPFASPIIMVPNPNGTWRLCTDYRFVNDQTELISWPLPKIDEIIAETGGRKVFSTIDLLNGFWQQPLTEETKKFSALVTSFGTFEYNVNPFGWKNSPKLFQMMMDKVLHNHRSYCRWYIHPSIHPYYI